ncbi:MAG: hypothetical protein L0Y79_12525 [Chlorobi bacterium]|nr:hypothetical protein [Chlorobiota bacterium]MCI0716554.1 hypothetical protein [Chlorobiota bacterium]
MHRLKYFIIPVIAGIVISSCEKDDDSVIDPILNFPNLLSTSFTPIQFDSDTVNAIATAVVTSEEPIRRVIVTVFDPLNSTEVFELKDDGVSPDTTANDGTYNGRVFFVRSCRLVGDYRAEFIAENVSGLFSGTDSKSFSVIHSGNTPPVVSNIIIVPDSVQAGDSTFFIFMITATDPNGQCDIRDVFYIGFRPDNTQLSPLSLFDDGSCCIIPPFNTTSGDTTANDTKFTRRAFGGPNQLGYYRYYIRAVDRSDDTSNVLADSIYVYP